MKPSCVRRKEGEGFGDLSAIAAMCPKSHGVSGDRGLGRGTRGETDGTDMEGLQPHPTWRGPSLVLGGGGLVGKRW